MRYNITKSQLKILEFVANKKFKPMEIKKKLKMTTALVYKNISELEELGYVQKLDKDVVLTEAGRIGRLW